jgi:preprotein translocase subunit YajC
MGYSILAATSKTSSSGGTSLLPLLLIVVVVILLYYTMTRRSRQRQAAQMQTALVPGQPVRTTGGMYGTVASMEGDDVNIEVAPGVQIRMMRRAVVPIAPDGASANGVGPTAAGTDPADSSDTEADAADSTAATNGSQPEPESSDDDAFDDRKSQDRNF